MVLDGKIEVADDLKLLESTSEENLNQVGNEETAFSFRRVRVCLFHTRYISHVLTGFFE